MPAEHGPQEARRARNLMSAGPARRQQRCKTRARRFTIGASAP